ncbi:glutaminase A [Pontiella agarivorans]|uniref:Glutaminase n=1 Tax=Pontiella agarivorans TaxID=3038953 RepID=A0ABU5MYG7_9BACT|nr:glutaminase A [Pontiella agarivorans]MDZ8119259.1 glutaminase A [Pontiella agarivorans]
MQALSYSAVFLSSLISIGVYAGAGKAPQPPADDNLSLSGTLAEPSFSGITASRLQTAVDKAYADFKNLSEGRNADYIPILTETPSNLFGIVLATPDGTLFSAGDVEYKFSIQSISKPFTAALVMNQTSPEVLKEKIGVEPTGLPFNSKLALEIYEKRSVNPLVNAGAIAAVSLINADSEDKRWYLIRQNLSDFAGSELELLEKVYQSEYDTAWSNRAIANLLYSYHRLYCDPEEALRVYTKQCALGVSCENLAIMGATLANGGKNPITVKQVLQKEHVPELLAIMATAGFYDESGEWMAQAGLPAKTGVGGGIVAVVPGKFAIAAFSPRLNASGNSIKAMKAIRQISGELGLGIYGANPE